MSPYEVQILIACCSSPEPGLYWPEDTDLRRRTLLWMMGEELIDASYRGTERAKFWLEVAFNTPLPVHNWVIPESTKCRPTN